MDDAPAVPLVFANRVIRQFADHLGITQTIRPRDYMIIRLVFRKLGGQWDAFIHGDIKQITTLEKVITNWGKVKKPDEPEEEEI